MREEKVLSFDAISKAWEHENYERGRRGTNLEGREGKVYNLMKYRKLIQEDFLLNREEARGLLLPLVREILNLGKGSPVNQTTL